MMPGGRPSYSPSENDRALVRNMAAAGLAANNIQRCLPTAPKSEKTFRKAFRSELDTSADIVTAKAISKLVVKIDQGDLGAICFWLKTKAGFRETFGQVHRLVDENGSDKDIKIILEHVEAPLPLPAPAK